MNLTPRHRMPVYTGTRNIPEAQRLLRQGDICSVFWRLTDGTPVLCAMPEDEQHEHRQPAPPPEPPLWKRTLARVVRYCDRRWL